MEEIHHRYPQINLALIHLGGTTLPIIHVMVTMDAEQGIKLLCALQPEKVIPIQYVGLVEKVLI
jgi:L-ascorbate metabolism protein UlaG (beta-lactamase superfamily)